MTDPEVSVNDEQTTADQEQIDQENAAEATEALSDEEKLQAKLKEAMQVEVEDIGGLRRKITITVPRETIDELLQEEFDEIKYEAIVPGFRKGRAPVKLIEKRFGTEVGDKLTASLMGNSYMAAVDKESLDVLGDPLIRLSVKEERTDEGGKPQQVDVEKLLPIEKALDHIELPKEDSFTYSCEVDLRPEFELPELKEIPIERPKLEVTDDDVEKEILRIRQMRGTFRPVEGGKVEENDLIVCNLKLTVDGETIKSEDNAELAARDQRYDGLPLEGFGKAVIGKKSGDEVPHKVTIPEDYENVDQRGKEATLSVTVLDIKRLDVPELDDEFLKNVGFENESELRDFLRERMASEIDHAVQQGMRGQIKKYLLEKADFEVPAGISRRQADRIVAQRMLDLYRRGVPEAEITKLGDQLRVGAAEEARDDLKLLFIMEKIGEENEITVTEEEINAAIAQIAQRRNRRFDRVRDEIIKSEGLQSLYLDLRDTKILDALIADAKVTEMDAAEEKKSGKKKGTKKKEDASD